MEKEKAYLESATSAINNEILNLNREIKKNKQSIQIMRDQLTNNFSDIDNEELSRYKVDIDASERILEVLEKRKSILEKQVDRPFFARVDFKTDIEQKIYIGLGLIKEKEDILVYDWRAPISSIYYDYDVGPAEYQCEDGVVKGEMTLKRQFNISDQTLNYYIDTKETINDEILREVLSKNTSSKMREIVSTIQREQNKLIRCNEDKNIIVQGVAGSGKTSVALHRAAYLLYKNKNDIKSDEIFILSPSNLFSNYIADVLPELGESNVLETTFLTIAKTELNERVATREYLIEEICKNKTKSLLEGIAYKSSFAYLEDLLEFLENTFANTFRARELAFYAKEDEPPLFVFTKEEMEKLYYETYKDLPVYKRIEYMSEYLIERFNLKKKEFLPIKERFVNFMYKFFPTIEVKKMHDLFLSTKGIETSDDKVIRYDDIAGCMIIYDYIFGMKINIPTKYIIIDEMQDFTPAHFYLINKLWDCPKLLLGDINQCLEKKLTPNYLDMVADYFNAEKITLNKTYRSTKEISQFCQKIIGLKDVVNMNRSGEKPSIIKTDNQIEEIIKIFNEDCDKYKHIAVICKTKEEVEKTYQQLKDYCPIRKLSDTDDGYNYKYIITTPASSKGVEFDSVIIPNAEDGNYFDELDKNLLYISGTRALHKLTILYTDKLSHLIKE